MIYFINIIQTLIFNFNLQNTENIKMINFCTYICNLFIAVCTPLSSAHSAGMADEEMTKHCLGEEMQIATCCGSQKLSQLACAGEI